MTGLCQIAARHGCDKCPAIGHDYTPVYAQIIPRTARRLLEIGIGSPSVMSFVDGYKPGASLRMWAEWCPAAEIYGVDIDPACASVSGERIRVAIADATGDDVFPDVGPFDVIIDDGSHRVHDQLTSLCGLVHRLADGGTYVIEDVRDYAPILAAADSLGLAVTIYEWPDRPMSGDNRLVVLTRKNQ